MCRLQGRRIKDVCVWSWWAPMMLQRTLANSGQSRQPSLCSVTAKENNNKTTQTVYSSKPLSQLLRCLHLTDMHWISMLCSADFCVSLDSCPISDTEQGSDRVWITSHLWGSILESLRSSLLAVQRLCLLNKWKKTLCQGNTLSIVTLSAVPVLQPRRYVCDAQ